MQTISSRTSRPAGRVVIGLLCFAAGLSGCFETAPEPADVALMPEGFIFDANASMGRNVFPDRQILHQVAWTNLAEEKHASLFMTEYHGPSTRAEIEAAREFQESRYSSYLDYGPLEEITIDGRTAYGWLETQYFEGQLSSREYKAVVSYDDVTYAIEFFARDPIYREAATLEEWVTTFHGPKEAGTSWAKVLITVVLIGTPVVLVVKKVFSPGYGTPDSEDEEYRKSA